MLSLMMIIICALTWAATPFYRPGSAAIELSPSEITFWPSGCKRASAPWDSSPMFLKYATMRGIPHVVLTTRYGAIYFSIDSLPLGCEQLHKLLVFYNNHPELREELAQQRGLERVRELMYASLNEVEAGLERERTQTASQSTQSHKRSPSPQKPDHHQ